MAEETLRPAQLRGILNYVPLFREHCFVVGLDSGVVQSSALPDLVKDLAVLRSLRIRLVLTFGIGAQLRLLAQQRRLVLSSENGSGPVDQATLELAQEAAGSLMQVLQRELTAKQLRWVVPNAVRAEAVGVRGGVPQGAAGRVGKVDVALLKALMDHECLPLLGPIQHDREGVPLRLNSDDLASRLALETAASKLIYLTVDSGLMVDNRAEINLPLADLRNLVEQQPHRLAEHQLPKARQALFALNNGVDRAHILNGLINGALLTEVFDKVGLGTMIHADAYQQIRVARPKDVSAIFAILRAGARTEALRGVTRKQVEELIQDFFVYEADGAIIGCCRLVPLNPPHDVELAGVLVQPAYQRKGIGRTLVSFGIEEARRRGFQRLIALTTQAGSFFTGLGFEDVDRTILPAPRRQELEAGGRNSLVLAYNLRPAAS